MLAFPRFRAPHKDAEGGSSYDLGGSVLNGAHILLVEDDFIVGFDMQTLLEEHGATVVGPAASLDEARAALQAHARTIRLAVLDVNLNGQYVFPLADELRREGIQILFATAYADDERLFPADLRDAPRLAKPVMPNVLIGQVSRLLK